MKQLLMTPLLVGFAASVLSAQEPARKPATDPATAEAQLRGALRCKASQLIGCEITNTKNESLGEIQDIVFDAGNRQVAYAVVAFGGFLGMGEKYFAMPWRLIEIGQRGTDDAPRATLGLDKATLEKAPGFDKNQWPDMANPSWAAQVDEYYRSRNETAGPEGAKEPKGSGVEGKKGVDRAPDSKLFVHRRLSRLIGMNVVDAQSRKLADVEDLVIDTRRATIDGALLGFGGTLGVGEQLALVPAESLTLDHAKNVFVFLPAKAGLEALALPDGKCPALHNDEWLAHGRGVCAKLVKEMATDGDVIPVPASGVKPVPFADTYDLTKSETVKGTITTIGSVRIGDLTEERVRLRVHVAEGREVIVYAAPATWKDQKDLNLCPGTLVEVTGSPAQYGTSTVLVAGTITAGGKTARLRDEKGQVTWTRK